MHAGARAGDPNVSQPAFFLEPGGAVLVHRPLVGEQPFLPAGQEDGIELQPLGAVQGHQADHVAVRALDHVHYQRDMFEETGKVLELRHRGDKLLEVLQPPRRLGRFVVLPHPGIARFVEHRFGELTMRHALGEHPPALEIGQKIAQRPARGQLQLVGLDQQPRGGGQ